MTFSFCFLLLFGGRGMCLCGLCLAVFRLLHTILCSGKILLNAKPGSVTCKVGNVLPADLSSWSLTCSLRLKEALYDYVPLCVLVCVHMYACLFVCALVSEYLHNMCMFMSAQMHLCVSVYWVLVVSSLQSLLHITLVTLVSFPGINMYIFWVTLNYRVIHCWITFDAVLKPPDRWTQ